MSRYFFWVPNTITALNLVCGSMAVFFAIDGQLGWSAVFVFAAALFDFLDGLSARLLNSYTVIGKELDSLADMISFGLAPAAMIFTMLELTLFGQNFLIQEIEAGWSVWIVLFTSLLIPVAGAFRLAKFNTDDRQTDQFMGMPIPANAFFFASLALIIELENSLIVSEIILNKYVILASVFMVSFLMVSELPMFSLKFKNLKFKENSIRYLFIGVIILLLLFLKVYALPLIIIWYVVLSVIRHLSRVKN